MSRRTRKTRRRRQRQTSTWQSLINKWTLGGAALVVVGLVAFLIAANQSPSATSNAPSAANQANIPAPEVPRIPLADAKTEFDQNGALFVDTRSQAEYQSSHIPDAVSLPLTDLSGSNPDLPRDAEIITYCTWPNEETSARAAQILMNIGYEKVSALRGGFGAWQGAGYPVSSGQ